MEVAQRVKSQQSLLRALFQVLPINYLPDASLQRKLEEEAHLANVCKFLVKMSRDGFPTATSNGNLGAGKLVSHTDLAENKLKEGKKALGINAMDIDNKELHTNATQGEFHTNGVNRKDTSTCRGLVYLHVDGTHNGICKQRRMFKYNPSAPNQMRSSACRMIQTLAYMMRIPGWMTCKAVRKLLAKMTRDGLLTTTSNRSVDKLFIHSGLPENKLKMVNKAFGTNAMGVDDNKMHNIATEEEFTTDAVSKSSPGSYDAAQNTYLKSLLCCMWEAIDGLRSGSIKQERMFKYNTITSNQMWRSGCMMIQTSVHMMRTLDRIPYKSAAGGLPGGSKLTYADMVAMTGVPPPRRPLRNQIRPGESGGSEEVIGSSGWPLDRHLVRAAFADRTGDVTHLVLAFRFNGLKRHQDHTCKLHGGWPASLVVHFGENFFDSITMDKDVISKVFKEGCFVVYPECKFELTLNEYNEMTEFWTLKDHMTDGQKWDFWTEQFYRHGIFLKGKFKDCGAYFRKVLQMGKSYIRQLDRVFRENVKEGDRHDLKHIRNLLKNGLGHQCSISVENRRIHEIKFAFVYNKEVLTKVPSGQSWEHGGVLRF